MTCKRCGCTETTPCLRDGRPCAWMLPDLCTACLTPEEAAIDKAYAGIIAGLRTEQLFQRCLLAIAPGLATDPSLRADTRAFVERATTRIWSSVCPVPVAGAWRMARPGRPRAGPRTRASAGSGRTMRGPRCAG